MEQTKEKCLEDIRRLLKLTYNEKLVFNHLLDDFAYAGIIEMNDLAKREFGEELGIPEYSLKNIISSLIKKKALIRTGRSQYKLYKTYADLVDMNGVDSLTISYITGSISIKGIDNE